MRYRPEHKAETHERIVKDAARRFRSEGLSGAGVARVMKDAGLTHGGFYKHFAGKDDLMVEAIREAFQELRASLVRAAEEAPQTEAWKAMVRAYLSPEHCNHPETGCPLAALAPELARIDGPAKKQIQATMRDYKESLLPFMPGRRAADRERAFFVIFPALLGAIAFARMIGDPVAQGQVLRNMRDFLLAELA